jgi:hypothetical protein
MIKHWVGLWDYLDGNFWGFYQWAASHLSPVEVGWQPVPEVASIGWNLQHLGEMLDHYLAHVFAQGELVQRTPLATMRPGSRDDGQHCDLNAIGAYHRQVRPAYRAFLSRLTAVDLDRPLGDAGRTLTWAWAVGHIAEHESYHLGKCMLLRNLLPNSRAH